MTRQKKITAALLCLLAIVVVALLVIWSQFGYRAQKYENESYAMGTYIQQTVYGKNAQAASTAAAQAVTKLENQISWRVEGSDIDRLNNAAGTTWEKIDSETTKLLSLALEVAQKSGGAFDPTVLPLTSLWRMESENPHVPTDTELKNALQYVGYSDLRINTLQNTASLRRHYEGIDLGALGKGAACDTVESIYQQYKLTAGVIAAGGSIGVYGTKPDGTNWLIAVRDPKTSDDAAGSIGTIQLENGEFVSTSGPYEKNFTQNGKTYHHLINPKTGMPENNGLVSVSVVCKNGALSDALSTACFVLGKDKGAALAKTYEADILFVEENGKVTASAGMKEKFQLTNHNYLMSS